jgi:plasmid stabilization system protein ParE
VSYQVHILYRAEADYREILTYLFKRSSAGAKSWATSFDRAIVRLESQADWFPLAPENSFTDFEVRQLLFNTRRGLIYRVLFMIHEMDVFIMRVRGPGQDFLKAEELGERPVS